MFAWFRVVQRGRGFGFPLKPRQCLLIFGYIIRGGTSGRQTDRASHLGLVNHTHSTTTQLLDDAVVRDGLPDHWAEILGLEARQVNESVQVGCI